MPNLFHTLRYGIRKYIQPHRVRIFHVATRVLFLLLIAVLLECFLFNFKAWTTMSLKPTDLSDKINLTQTSDGRYVVTSTQNTIELKNINQKVNNLFINFSPEQDTQEVTISLNFTDSGHSTFFDTTEYTVGVPDIKVATNSERSQYLSLQATGEIKSIKLQIADEKVNYPLYISSISINEPYPFEFVIWRFLAAFALLFMIYAFRPGSSVYKLKLLDRPIYSRVIISLTAVVEIALVTAYLLMGSNLVGVATSSYNYGDWDGVSVVNTYKVAGDNAQQYAELAKAFTQSQLHLTQEPPSYLQDLDDPYDKGSRDEMQKKTGEKYLHDVAYYNGHYYVYFGVVPVLLFYLPFYLITGQNFPTAIGVLIMAILFIVGITILLDRFARYHFKRVSLGLYLLLQIPMVICSGLLYLIKFPTFYSLPIACGLAFAVWGLYFWMRARTSYKPCGWFLAGSFCMALIAGCRPQLLLVALVAIPLFWRHYITNRHKYGICTKKGVIEIICFVIPFVVVAAGIMWYNYARFGSPTNFGANYNLTMNDMTLRGIQLSRVAPALFSYLLQPPNVTGVFPFLNPVEFDTTYLGQTIKEVTFGGVLVCLPVLWILFFMKPILAERKKVRQTNTIAGVIGVLIISAILIAILDAQMAGILQRYYADFSFMLLISACLLAFILNETLCKAPKKIVKIILCVLLVLVMISVIYSILTCFVVESGWYGDAYKWAWRDILAHIQFWR